MPASYPNEKAECVKPARKREMENTTYQKKHEMEVINMQYSLA